MVAAYNDLINGHRLGIRCLNERFVVRNGNVTQIIVGKRVGLICEQVAPKSLCAEVLKHPPEHGSFAANVAGLCIKPVSGLYRGTN